jgi:hypothetical protein
MINRPQRLRRHLNYNAVYKPRNLCYNCLALISTTLHLLTVANLIADVDGVINPYSKVGLASLPD